MNWRIFSGWDFASDACHFLASIGIDLVFEQDLIKAQMEK
jgi:hypothetical protein